ncbi:hypothetical protein GCM10011378_16180 [Hymenobacter glacieicola]|uniref:Uncharacterized protein n=2 Tax=Hymenobacter glacieicola TaxID=1562124 RepID=A0ABQ1WS35_9BACT|nr:hypothetical protein GCM10011378_16180 [Hymenobacter glacieicola]
MNAYQSGDQLLIFIAYQNLALVAADGALTPLLAKPVSPGPGQLDLQTDESKGISFRWVLRKP